MDEIDERFSEQQQDEQKLRRKLSSGPGRLWAGLFLLLVGGVLLLDQMGFPLPDWLFSWHILLIAIGLFLGLRHNFRGGAWLILILVGGCFLIQDFYPKTELRRFVAPCVLIFIGFIIIFRPKNRWRHNHNPWKDEWKEHMKSHMRDKWQHQKWAERHHRWTPPGSFGGPGGGPNSFSSPGYGPGTPPSQPGPTEQAMPAGPTANTEPINQPNANPETAQTPPPNGNQTNSKSDSAGGVFTTQGGYSSEDYIDTTSIFGGVHKKVVSKNFKGGDIVTFLGGSEIDLSQADIIGTARLDVTQVMGGTKIIVPAHWEVRSEVTALFAGFEDKRQQPAMINPEKVLIIDGTSIFGGIELKNY